MAKKVIQQVEAEILDYSELSSSERCLVDDAKSAVAGAYAPYSDFHVGSAVLLADGIVVKGSNQENAAYPSGLCAERVAIFSAGANHPNVKIEKLAIAAKPAEAKDFVAASSCGNCRQAMMEYQSRQEETIELLFIRPGNQILKTTVRDLLPFGFDSNSLNK
ncbi:MAG: cytidine deaminase [Reichenbachiella sp.]|uniref:cytidine deaminase n=1 Tax=Reichenbachiella sp. TaxID=2184521 RepID=UPI003265C08C